MARFKVLVTDQVFPDVEVERRLLGEIDAELEVADGTIEDTLARGEDADGLLNTYLPLDAQALRRLGKCRVIARYGIGVDNIDIVAAEQAGIAVTNVPDYCVEEVAVHTLALMLALHRRFPEADAAVKEGRFTIDAVRPISRFSELTVGLIGYGKIARRVAAVLGALGASLLAYDPYVRPEPDGPSMVSLEELLSRSDIVSVHVPLTPETRGLIGTHELELMPPHAILVNTSRGPIVVLDDLLPALLQGKMAAGLDVFDQEPPEPERLRGVPGLIATPHMAFYSEDAVRESQRKAATQIIKVLTGQEPDYRVRPAQ